MNQIASAARTRPTTSRPITVDHWIAPVAADRRMTWASQVANNVVPSAPPSIGCAVPIGSVTVDHRGVQVALPHPPAGKATTRPGTVPNTRPPATTGNPAAAGPVHNRRPVAPS